LGCETLSKKETLLSSLWFVSCSLNFFIIGKIWCKSKSKKFKIKNEVIFEVFHQQKSGKKKVKKLQIFLYLVFSVQPKV